MPSSGTGDKNKSHIDGSDVGHVYPTKKIKQLMDSLEKNPGSVENRLHLIALVSQADQDYDLAVYKNLLMQSLTTLYLGELGPASIKLAVQTYCTYLKKLCGFYKVQLLKIRSEKLKKVNYSKLNLKASVDPDDEEKWKMITELRVAETLLEKSRGIESSVQQKIRLPLKMQELDQLIRNQGDAHLSAGSKVRHVVQVDTATARQSLFDEKQKASSASENINKNVVLRKALAVVDITKSIPLFHPVGLKIVQKIKDIGGVDNLAFVMEGRIYMKAVQHYLLRIESGDESCENAIAPTFNKAVVAYRSAMKYFGRKNPEKRDLSPLVEYASLAHYAYVCRKSMKLTKGGLQTLLQEGKKAVDAAVLLDSSYTSLQSKLIMALENTWSPEV